MVAPHGTARILVVDGDAAVLSAMSEALRAVGYSVAKASNGSEALRLFAEDAIDLTIVDIFLQKMGGIEVLLRIKRMAPAAKVICMSSGGVIDQGYAFDIARQLGATEVLAKPFDTARLAGVVGGVLPHAAGVDRYWVMRKELHF